MPLSASDRALIKEFYTVLAMADIREEPGGFYLLPYAGGPYRHQVRAKLNQAAIDEYGGKIIGMKLLRHAEAAKFFCRAGEDGRRTFDLIGSHFLRVAERWPLLRSYYEMARTGAYQWSG